MRITWIYLILSCLIIVSCDNPNARKEEVTDNHQKTETIATVDSFEIKYPSLWVYGGPSDPKDDQRQIVDAWYNFRFIIKSSRCTDTPEDGTDKHNKITDSIMTARLGKDWYQIFERSVDSLYAIDSMAITIAQADRYIHNFDIATEKHNDKYGFYPNLRYTAHATSDDNIKVVTVEGYGVVYNDIGSMNYLRATVDIKRKKVINIDKTAYSSW